MAMSLILKDKKYIDKKYRDPWAVYGFRNKQSDYKIINQSELNNIIKKYSDINNNNNFSDEINIPENIAIKLKEQLSKIIINPYSKVTQFNFVTRARIVIKKYISRNILNKISKLKWFGHRGIIVIKGLKLDNYIGPTPLDGIEPEINNKKTFVAEALHLGFASLLGDIYTLEIEKGYRIVQTVAPVIGHEKFLGSTGSEDGFGMHQEDRMHPYSPEVLVLTCLRSDHKNIAQTCIVSFWDIAESLLKPDNEDLFLSLQKPIYALKLPQIFQEFGIDEERVGPILQFKNNIPILAINMNGMRGINEEGKKSLIRLCKLFEHTWTEIRLKPGNLVLIHNINVVHTRTSAFEVLADGKDRWLLRTFVHSNIPHKIIQKNSPLNKMSTFDKNDEFDIDFDDSSNNSNKSDEIINMNDFYDYEKDNDKNYNKSKKINNFKGLIYVGISGFFLSWMAVCVKIATLEITPMEIICVRCIISWLLILIICKYYIKISPFNDKDYLLLCGRGFSGGTGMICFYIGLSELEAGDANTLYFTSPVFTAIFGYIFLKEKFNIKTILCIIVVFGGAVLIARPRFIFGNDNYNDNTIFYIGVLSCIFAALGDAGSYIFIKKVNGDPHPIVFLNYLFFCTFFLAFIPGYILSFVGIDTGLISITVSFESIFSQSSTTILANIGLVCTGIIGQMFLSSGLRIAEAAPSSIVRSIDIVFVFIWQAIILNNAPDFISIIGGGLVLLGAVGIVLSKYQIIKNNIDERLLSSDHILYNTLHNPE